MTYSVSPGMRKIGTFFNFQAHSELFITLKGFVVLPCLDVGTVTTVNLLALKISTGIPLIVIVVMEYNLLTYYLSLFLSNQFVYSIPSNQILFLIFNFFSSVFPRYIIYSCLKSKHFKIQYYAKKACILIRWPPFSPLKFAKSTITVFYVFLGFYQPLE